jgi:putative flippase GtrA
MSSPPEFRNAPHHATGAVRPTLFRRLIRFGLTGLLVTCVHTIIAAALINAAAFSPVPANGIAFVGATLVSYAINTVWSFSRLLRGATLAKFVMVSALGLMLAMLVAKVADGLGLHYLLGIAAVAATVPPVTFLLHNYWTYR